MTTKNKQTKQQNGRRGRELKAFTVQKKKKKSMSKLACDLMTFHRLDLILQCVESTHKGVN